jgi:predicted nuclease of restriction endonuclease-like (RecB) superfamily
MTNGIVRNLMKNRIKTTSENMSELEQQFAYVNTIIERHRESAIRLVNGEALLTNWEIGQYISTQLKSSAWGDKVVSQLADYLKRMNPKRRGFGKRHLYNMVKFYDLYAKKEFSDLVMRLQLPENVQLPIAHFQETHLSNETIVQLPIAQIETAQIIMPAVLGLIPFTSHIEIMNRCRSNEERLFYMLYAAQQHLKTEELRRCIVNQTYSSLLEKDKMLSPALLDEYPNADFILKDKAFVDFLNLPKSHNEHHLHNGLLEHMKEFIMELGKDFLFMESEYGVQVGGSTKRIDLLFYHRALQCLVAIELKATDFEPEFVGKMDMYLEALDRDVKRENENPSIGIILCPSADRSMVEYTLSRSLSPTMVAEYQRKLIPQDVMQRSLQEYCDFLQKSINK